MAPWNNGGRRKQLYFLYSDSVFFIMFSVIFVLGYIFWSKQPSWDWSAAETRLNACCCLSKGCQMWDCNLFKQSTKVLIKEEQHFLGVKVLAQVFDWMTVSIVTEKTTQPAWYCQSWPNDPSTLHSWWSRQVYSLSKWHIGIILANCL